MAVEKYILAKRQYLGYINEGFNIGSVIELDPEKKSLRIDGRKFDDTRDIELLKTVSSRKPHDPPLVVYSEEVLQDILGATSAPKVPEKITNRKQSMPIVQHDDDEHEVIDIRHTQESRINREKRESQERAKSDSLDVIQGDESPSERLANTQKSDGMNAIAERVRRMQESDIRKSQIPIVHDDSLGSSEKSLNSGTKVSGRRAEETPDEVNGKYEKLKKEAEEKRQQAMIEEGLNPDEDEVAKNPIVMDSNQIHQEYEEASMESAEEEQSAGESKEERIARLEAELQSLRGEG